MNAQVTAGHQSASDGDEFRSKHKRMKQKKKKKKKKKEREEQKNTMKRRNNTEEQRTLFSFLFSILDAGPAFAVCSIHEHARQPPKIRGVLGKKNRFSAFERRGGWK